MNVGVVCATYGDLDVWKPRVLRAMSSVSLQTVHVPAVWVHGQNLAEARNGAIREIGTEWVIIVDADDELDPLYVEKMIESPYADIRRPNTIGVYADGSEDDAPCMIPVRDIRVANYIVIGAMFRRDLFFDVGGFDPQFACLEDWDLWLSMIERGASVIDVPEAVYRIHVSADSRNNEDPAAHGNAYRAIRAKHGS